MLSLKISLTIGIVLSIVSIVSHAETSLDVEIQALKAFKNSITADPNGALADWLDTHHHCNWSGIACDPSSNHVISISFVSLQLQGEISPFLGNIPGLQVLDLTSRRACLLLLHLEEHIYYCFTWITCYTTIISLGDSNSQ